MTAPKSVSYACARCGTRIEVHGLGYYACPVLAADALERRHVEVCTARAPAAPPTLRLVSEDR